MILDAIAFKKSATTTTTTVIVPRVFLYKISSKLKDLGTNFQYKPIFITKLSKSELKDESNGTEENETSADKYLSDFLKLQQYMYAPCVSKDFVKENCPGKKLSDSEEDTS